jgi:hypothetical protein
VNTENTASPQARVLDIPDWAISDDEVEAALPESGWIRDYVEYMREVTDAPLAYHYITAMTILSQACSGMDIRVYSSSAGRFHEVTMPIWSALIGTSGDRKSFAAKAGVDLLLRARGHHALLPTDGSLEAWTDYLVERPNVLMYRDELSYLFAQTSKSYLAGLKDWLLTLNSGSSYKRVLRSKGGDPGWEPGSVGKKRRRGLDGDDTEDSDEGQRPKGQDITVERPRLSILGAIPPEVFRQRSDKLDWTSGFFARFLFVGGSRTRSNAAPARCLETETVLARQLEKIARLATGYISISPASTQKIHEWFLEEIEPLRTDPMVSGAIYSHFLRYQDAAYRMAALATLSGARKPEDARVVKPGHIEPVLLFLACLKDAMVPLFGLTVQVAERLLDDEVKAFFTRNPRTWRTIEHVEQAFPAPGTAQLRAIVRGLYEERLLVRRTGKSDGRVGRPPFEYRIAQPKRTYKGWGNLDKQKPKNHQKTP